MANGGRAIPGGSGDPFQDLLANLIVDQFLAQQDATSTQNANPSFEAGTGADFLRNLFGVALDFTPGVGDVKAAGFDAPEQFAEGENMAGIISLISAIPGLGVLGDLIRAGGRGAARGAGNVLRSTTGARADALQPLRSRASSAGGSEDPLSNLLNQIGGERPGAGGRVSTGAAQAGPGNIESIREQIFRELVEPDPFGDAEKIRRSVVDQIEELAKRRAGGN
jgi:hypothetical protein